MPRLQFFDISNKNKTPWSLNTIKVRMCLNYKQIPYDTVWLSYTEPTIEANHKALGIKPNNDQVGPRYTCPAIKHGDVVMQESQDIIEYLEKEFPDTPSVLGQPGSRATLQLYSDYTRATLGPVIHKLIQPNTLSILDEKDGAVYAARLIERVGMPLSEYCTKQEDQVAQAKLQEGVMKVGRLWQVEAGPFFYGDEQPSYIDFTVVGFLAWVKQIRPDCFDRIIGSPGLKALWDASQRYLF